MSKLKLSPKVLHQEVAGESVLLDLASEQYFGLNAVGTVVWNGLAEGLDADALTARVVAAFDVDAERARADVDALLRDLADAGLIEA